jgi:tetratricopeptide (TPR) repeat protein
MSRAMVVGCIRTVGSACLLAVAAFIGMEGNSFGQGLGSRTEATSCAAAIGGNVTSSSISVVCGVPPEVLDALVKSRTQTLEELSSSQKDTITLLKQNLDLNQQQIKTALGILGETNVPPERLAAKLLEVAERFRELQQTAIVKPGDDAKIAALKADVQKAIRAGDLGKADALLAKVETAQRQIRQRLTADEAETAEKRADIAMTRLRYAEAAKHYENAASLLTSVAKGERTRLDYLNKEANALYRQGSEYGDNAALETAINRYQQIIDLRPRNQVPGAWAAAQDNLGTALFTLGERESGNAKLDEAVAAYREALKERAGPDRAMTQNNLGNALARLGERGDDTARIEEAAAAYREALKEYTRERVPLDWARTQNNLANVLVNLSVHESSMARLEEAITAYREALKEWSRERLPLSWATTQHNLGVALWGLSGYEKGAARLEEAVAAYREALKERTRQRVPLDWAMSFGMQGVTLLELARLKRNADMAQTAMDQIKAARTVLIAVRHPSASFYEEELKGAQSIVKELKRR